MRQTRLFSKTLKSSKEYDAINATLLIKGGFIEQVMAGSYTYLPLGLRVLNKIENIVRKEMDKISVEVKMPSLSPKELWEITGRLEKIDVLIQTNPANKKAAEKNDSSYILNPTHEEIITPLAKSFRTSYKDFPFSAYQIQTKFRNETRPKSGLLRSREFLMKDLYSFHASEESLKDFYENIKTNYLNIYKSLGLGAETIIALASGGDFTTDYSHEFQTKCETGEDLIFYVESKNTYYNREVAPTSTGQLAKEGDKYPETGETYEVFKASEVGNIFTLSTKFSKDFDYYYTDKDGQRGEIFMGCYGIGISRLMGVIVEKFHDDKGIIWPETVAPYKVHLLGLGLDMEEVKEFCEEAYEKLGKAGIEVLYDDREEVGPGEKFRDADLIGIPYRLVVSKKTGKLIEVKKRSQDIIENQNLDTLIESLLSH